MNNIEGHEGHTVMGMLSEDGTSATPIYCSTCGTRWVR